jgi:hypothetical protein
MRRSLSTSELANLMRDVRTVPTAELERLLAEDHERGVVEQVDGRRRLTDHAERQHGEALRDVRLAS